MEKTPKKPKGEPKIMLIPGNKDMTPTGFTVHEKDQVTIKASGYIYFSDGKAQSKVDPDGWARSNYVDDWGDNANFCDDPLMEENHAALIADVDGEKFPVGKEATLGERPGCFISGSTIAPSPAISTTQVSSAWSSRSKGPAALNNRLAAVFPSAPSTKKPALTFPARPKLP